MPERERRSSAYFWICVAGSRGSRYSSLTKQAVRRSKSLVHSQSLKIGVGACGLSSEDRFLHILRHAADGLPHPRVRPQHFGNLTSFHCPNDRHEAVRLTAISVCKLGIGGNRGATGRTSRGSPCSGGGHQYLEQDCNPLPRPAAGRQQAGGRLRISRSVSVLLRIASSGAHRCRRRRGSSTRLFRPACGLRAQAPPQSMNCRESSCLQ